MTTPAPLVFTELFKLPQLGINPAGIGFSTVTMQSANWIAVRQVDASGAAQVVIVNVNNFNDPLRFPVSADSAIMHYSRNVLALKAGNQLQIFDLDRQAKLTDHVMKEAVVFWHWISDTTIGLVTAGAAYHWDINAATGPVHLFDRHASLQGSEIVSYRSSADGKWLVLLGYAPGANNQVAGKLQLYSVEKRMSQPIDGHAACFALFKVRGNKANSTLFCFANRTGAQAKLFIIEVEKGDPAGPAFARVGVDIAFPAEAAGDIPLSMQYSARFDVLYMVTKFGYLYVFDIETGKTIYRNRISSEPVFVSAAHDTTGGFIGINKLGQVLNVALDANKIVPFIISAGDVAFALRMAGRNNLPGADDMFRQHFDQLFSQGRFKEAAQVAAESPEGALRTPQTIQRFQGAPAIPNQPSPLLQYFSVLLETSKLNQVESLELCRPVLLQGRKQLLQEWLDNDKLTCSEELGDLVRQHDANLALKVYYLAQAKAKVVALFAELGQFDKIAQYCEQAQYQADWPYLLQLVLSTNPQAAVALAQNLVKASPATGQPLADVSVVTDIFIQRNLIQQATSILFDVIKEQGDIPQLAGLQTRLLEINLTHGHKTVADALLGSGGMTQFDKPRIAKMCEQVGLYQRALELYTDYPDRRRVMMQTHLINSAFLVEYFANLDPDQGLEVLTDMMTGNTQQNLPVVVEVAAKFSVAFGSDKLVALFDNFQSTEGLFRYLSRIVATSDDPDLVFRYIESAAKMGQVKEVERVVKESAVYDAEKVRDFLMEQNLSDQLPLVIVCDKHGYVDKLTQYLYQRNLSPYIEAYVQKINPGNTPIVVGALLDSDSSEDFISRLVMSVGARAPAAELVEQAERRNRLKLLQPWLEARVAEQNQEEAVHNALAKIYVDMNESPKEFLINNQFYNSKVVGLYCENRDPFLAYIAYRRGLCDDELIALTNNQGLFKDQARYLVERQDAELWARVLTDDNEFKRNVVDQVVQTALPESKNPEEVSTTVKAFMTADLPNELIELLEKIVLESSEFSANRNLQNLLILTAIKATKDRVMDYVTRLENYDAPDIANIAIGAGLFEEAFVVFQRNGHPKEAITVLIDHIQNLDRAAEFAERIGEAPVYSKLARAQLNAGLVKLAIASYLKAEDHEYFLDVIRAAGAAGLYEDLTKFLLMARKKIKNQTVESELAFCHAKNDKLADLEEFINSPNSANIQSVGDRCYQDELYNAAKILFQSINNHARLASTLVKLGEFSAAVEAARRANSLRTWKEVCFECVEKGEFRLAQIAGLNVVIHADHLDEVVRYYKASGHWDHLMEMLEQGLGLERAHVNMFTELAILYSDFRPAKLTEHLKLFHARINKHKVIRVCENNLQWKDVTFLYTQNNEFDHAVKTMMSHSSECWEQVLFKQTLSKVSQQELFYKAIAFYLERHPKELEDLLSGLPVDHNRVVKLAREKKHLPLFFNHLKSVQGVNLESVNNALNELYVEEGNYEDLRTSIESFDNFDSLALAALTEKHDLVEFRRIASLLLKRKGKFAQSIELSKKDKLWKDAMETAAASEDTEVAEGLLQFFVDQELPECFAATLYNCYHVIRADVALELAWANQMFDFVMPFLIQTLREYIPKINAIDARQREQEEAARAASEAAQQAAQAAQVAGGPPGSVPPGSYPGTGVAAAFPPQQGFAPPGGAPMPMAYPMPAGGAPGMAPPVAMAPAGVGVAPNVMGAYPGPPGSGGF